MPDLKGPAKWMAWLVEIGVIVDAGRPGIDPSFGAGVMDLERLLDWIIDNAIPRI
jgi:hypothetical protein